MVGELAQDIVAEVTGFTGGEFAPFGEFEAVGRRFESIAGSGHITPQG
jgi:hypothetical protein